MTTWLRDRIHRFVNPDLPGVSARDRLLVRRSRGFGVVTLVLIACGGIAAAWMEGFRALAALVVALSILIAAGLRFSTVAQARYCRAITHAIIGLILVAIDAAAIYLGGATAINVTYPSLLILGTTYVLGVRAAAGWTTAAIAGLAVVVSLSELPPLAAGSYHPNHVSMFALRSLVFVATFALAALGRRFEDQQTAQLEFLARRDPLTGLVNRRELRERLEAALARCHRYGLRLALLYVDLDGFKQVNDGFGHSAGDALLEAVAQRIRRLTRVTDTAARGGGDEFVIVLESLDQPKSAEIYARRLLEQLSRPLESNPDVAVSASIGIAIHPDHADTADALLRAADAAMYRAKRAGGRRVVLAGRSETT